MRRLICIAFALTGCVVFNPNHVPLNPFVKPSPCFQVYFNPEQDLEHQAEQQNDEAWITRHQRATYWSPKCQAWREAHPGADLSTAEQTQRLKDYEKLPGW